MRRAVTVTAASAALFLVALAGGTPALADDTPPAPVAAATTTAPSTPSADPTDPPPPINVDAALQPFSGPDLGPVARGGDLGVSFSVTGAPDGGTVTLTVPSPLTFTAARVDDTPITCTPTGTTVVCAVGANDTIVTLTVTVSLPADAPIGARPAITGVLVPVGGADNNPADNTATVSLTVAGRAEVVQTQSTKTIEVPLGGTAPFTVTLTNNGPDPATNARIGFAINSNDATRPTLAGFDRPVERGNGSFTWNAGTIAVGGSVSITVTVSATGPVVDSALSFSSSYDGVGEICVNRACLSGAPIRTVAAAPQGGGAPAGGGPVLAETGSADRELALVAAGLLVGGAALTAAGRRRRTV